MKFLFLLLFTLTTFLTRGADSFIPPSDDTVVGQLNSGFSKEADRALKKLRAQLREQPENLSLASQIARELIRRTRATADPRHLSYAQAALKPWWDQPEPPVEAVVLRATIRQSLHDFDTARTDLEQALRRDPANAQAWLTLAAIDLVQGRYDQARQAALQLTRHADELTATTVAAGLGSLTGQAQRAAERLDQMLRRNPTASVELRSWATTQLAEIHARLGHAADADKQFQAALKLDANDPYALGSYSDFLLDHNRGGEVINLLADRTRQDGLLLRLTEARQQRGQPDDLAALPALVAELETRFNAGRLGGRSIHQREEARFLLNLKRDAKAALPLALKNWTIQREPGDARLVLEAALGAKQFQAAAPVVEFIRENRLEDVTLQRLAERLNPPTVTASNKP
jgi:tetratricopeptide (TPR) repeat protein